MRMNHSRQPTVGVRMTHSRLAPTSVNRLMKRTQKHAANFSIDSGHSYNCSKWDTPRCNAQLKQLWYNFGNWTAWGSIVISVNKTDKFSANQLLGQSILQTHIIGAHGLDSAGSRCVHGQDTLKQLLSHRTLWVEANFSTHWESTTFPSRIPQEWVTSDAKYFPYCTEQP
jgi:hypothetical protein